jgi:hypothetical protein
MARLPDRPRLSDCPRCLVQRERAGGDLKVLIAACSGVISKYRSPSLNLLSFPRSVIPVPSVERFRLRQCVQTNPSPESFNAIYACGPGPCANSWRSNKFFNPEDLPRTNKQTPVTDGERSCGPLPRSASL